MDSTTTLFKAVFINAEKVVRFLLCTIALVPANQNHMYFMLPEVGCPELPVNFILNWNDNLAAILKAKLTFNWLSSVHSYFYLFFAGAIEAIFVGISFIFGAFIQGPVETSLKRKS